MGTSGSSMKPQLNSKSSSIAKNPVIDPIKNIFSNKNIPLQRSN